MATVDPKVITVLKAYQEKNQKSAAELKRSIALYAKKINKFYKP